MENGSCPSQYLYYASTLARRLADVGTTTTRGETHAHFKLRWLFTSGFSFLISRELKLMDTYACSEGFELMSAIRLAREHPSAQGAGGALASDWLVPCSRSSRCQSLLVSWSRFADGVWVPVSNSPDAANGSLGFYRCSISSTSLIAHWSAFPDQQQTLVCH